MTQPPPPGPYPQQGPGWPYPPPSGTPLYKRMWFVVVATVSAVVLLSAALGGGGPDPTAPVGSAEVAAAYPTADPSPADSAITDQGAAEPSGGLAATPSAPPAVPGVGQPAADGDFSFIVHGVDCGRTQLGTQYFNTTAQGTFCIINLTVTNIGDRPRLFSPENCTLLNAEGQQFSADSGAAFCLEDAEWLFEEINPGNNLATNLVFDVPVDMAPTSIVLQESAFSGGVAVNLR